MNKQVNKTKGFTLIELLIVIAIIGILAGIIVVSLTGSTDAATDAKIRANLRSIDTIWKNDIIKDNDISTNDLCDKPEVVTLMTAVVADVASLHSITSIVSTPNNDNKLWAQQTISSTTSSAVGCVSSAEGWVAWARLSDDSNSDAVYQCIDTSGFSGTKTAEDPANLSTATNDPTCADNFS